MKIKGIELTEEMYITLYAKALYYRSKQGAMFFLGLTNAAKPPRPSGTPPKEGNFAGATARSYTT